MDVWEKKYQEDGINSQRRYPNESLIRFLAANYFSLKKREEIKVLELGCGSGANLWMTAKEGFDTYGIDASPTALKLCQETLDYWHVEAGISLADMTKLSFNNEFFDVIFDIVSMQHLDLKGHNRAYQEIFRCLKKGGRFFQWHLGAKSTSFLRSNGKHIDKLTVDNISDPNLPLLDIPFNKSGLTCFLTPKDAEEILGKIGFKNISIEVSSRTSKQMSQTTEFLAITCQKL